MHEPRFPAPFAVADLPSSGLVVAELRADGIAAAERLAALAEQQARLERWCRTFLDRLPNLFPVTSCLLKLIRGWA